ncbi:MAG: hypothetical protein XD91_1574 [Clostridiales bacterium 38_11]|nr:MAG: hypothetical protein XD91_1574 [Clostridiales bacterium 38_11]
MLKELDLSDELAIFYNREFHDHELLSMFISIRNAFAHGAFDIILRNGDKYYILENREPKSEEIRARFILKESTLLHWMDTIISGQ